MPANVTTSIRVTQLIAILIASVTQHSIRRGLNLFAEGYHEDSFGAAFGHNARYWNWLFAIIIQIMEGILSIWVTFLLIVTESNGLDLLLNFTAMEFVSFVDEVVFSISLQGFTGTKNLFAANVVLNTEYTPTKNKMPVPRYFVALITFLTMIIAWGAIMTYQLTGEILCGNVFVQFGDDVDARLASFSGFYDRQSGSMNAFNADRVYYVERRFQKAFLAYCVELGSWTFSLDKDGRLDPMFQLDSQIS